MRERESVRVVSRNTPAPQVERVAASLTRDVPALSSTEANLIRRGAKLPPASGRAGRSGVRAGRTRPRWRERGRSALRTTRDRASPPTARRGETGSGSVQGDAREARRSHSTDPRTDVAPGIPEAAICVQDVDVQCVLQFTLIHAAGCALHRRTSRVIHRVELFLVRRL